MYFNKNDISEITDVTAEELENKLLEDVSEIKQNCKECRKKCD